jgi:hypothetical protein
LNRRQLLQAGFVGAASLMSGCGQRWPSWAMIPPWLPIKVLNVGMQQGHRLRDLRQLPPVSAHRQVDTLILGSGMAALTAAFRLKQAGHRDVLMLDGVEWAGNSSAGVWQGLNYPRGAHYLPFPTPESTHVQQILRTLGMWQGGSTGDARQYRETDVVFAPTERLWQHGAWHDSIVPQVAKGSDSEQQLKRFLNFTDQLKGKRGRDGKRLFAIPVLLSSQDAEWRQLQQITFAEWLKAQGYHTPELLWYLNYSCKDDYGAGIDTVSAWAGLHYFASRVHEHDHHDATPLLTWPDGMHHLAMQMAQYAQVPRLPLTAIKLSTQAQSATVLAMDTRGKLTQIKAQRVISAMPLHVLKHVWDQAGEIGLQQPNALLPQVPWLVCNVWIDGVLPEKQGTGRCWENIIYGSESLGFVDATHQMLRASAQPKTVLTCYHAMTHLPPTQARQWLTHATPLELIELGLQDLLTAYGTSLWRYVQGVEVCVRGHAMSAPATGFLSHPVLERLRGVDGVVQVAHSDLSGYSIFEEASFWGWRAAEQILS